MSESPSTVESTISAFVANFRLADAPEAARESARRAIVDTVGVALAGGALLVAEATLRCARDRRPARGPVSSLYAGGAASPQDAAFAMAVAAHALDFDDTCLAGLIHGSAVIAPTVLAVGQAVDARGEDALEAFVAGSEAAYAIGAAVGCRLYDRGWIPTGCVAGIGAAAAAAKLMGLSAGQIANAMGFAASQSSGGRVNQGADSKPHLVGRAAELAAHSALMASAGLNAGSAPIGGRHGFFAMYVGGDVMLSEIDRIGATYRLVDPGLVIKQYPLCSCGQAPAEAAALISARRGGALPRGIECAVTPFIADTLTDRHPATPAQAQFSLPFAVATGFLTGEVAPRHLADDWFADPELGSTIASVRRSIDPDLSDGGRFLEAARVTVAFDDGRIESRVVQAPTGHPLAPLSDAALKSKFSRCAGDPIPSAAVDAIFDSLRYLDCEPSVDRVMRSIANANANHRQRIAHHA